MRDVWICTANGQIAIGKIAEEIELPLILESLQREINICCQNLAILFILRMDFFYMRLVLVLILLSRNDISQTNPGSVDLSKSLRITWNTLVVESLN